MFERNAKYDQMKCQISSQECFIWPEVALGLMHLTESWNYRYCRWYTQNNELKILTSFFVMLQVFIQHNRKNVENQYFCDIFCTSRNNSEAIDMHFTTKKQEFALCLENFSRKSDVYIFFSFYIFRFIFFLFKK